MNEIGTCRRRVYLGMVGRVLVAALSASALHAQSGVIMGTGDDMLKLLDSSGEVAVVFDVNELDETQVVRFGRADLFGRNQMNVDIELVDEDSTLATDEPSITLDSSGANIFLGSGSVSNPGSDGDLFLEDGMGSTSIVMNGETGNINQVVDNDYSNPGGNGAVKAWATISSVGTVSQCWNCDKDETKTRRIGVGEYRVRFTLGTVFRRPALATIACHFASFCPSEATSQPPAVIQVLPGTASYKVLIHDLAGDLADRNFTLVVF